MKKVKNNLSREQIEKILSFHNISENSMNRILEVGRVKSFSKGEVLFRAKDNIENIYAVLDGKLSMFRINNEGHKRVFFILSKGDLLNEVIFDNLPVSVDCESFENSTVLQIRKSDFLPIMEDDFDLTLKILSSIGKKQRRLYRQLKNTLPIGMEKKLAAKLWKLAKDYGAYDKLSICSATNKEEWKKIDMNISVTYLAYMLGTSRETISRAMKPLQNLGACKWEGRDLYVKENQLLEYYRS